MKTADNAKVSSAKELEDFVRFMMTDQKLDRLIIATAMSLINFSR